MFTNKLKALIVLLKRWHRDNFEDMDNRIKKFKEEIKKIDDKVSAGSYDGTMEARRKALVTCYAKWYVRKKMHWKQMSRSQHARDIDKNTRYFHNLASARRRNNRIDSLVLDGRLVRNHARIKTAIMGFYNELYRQEHAPLIGIRDGLVKQITEEKAAVLEEMPLTRKYERQCGIVSPVKLQKNAISDATSSGETQSAFVKGRKIHDGALIACETVHWLKLRKKEAAIVKLDFQKAYERVRWSFVDIVLQKMGIRLRWRTWVKECVTTASMSVLINGSPTKPFKMERGLRQGDPLSPFLFVLVVDILHRMVGEAVRNGRISPLLVGRDNIELSHLQFADDTILFCPHETETLLNNKRLLRVLS
ncbi:uncharacterized protein [Arachis hypogaea]|uniref:uncharacterized protein n=1 Tax=Arachis hypogaea TaxID=3818 RepID=UPI000DECA616|nr:uncharacterized protein LOC112709571 [Arachis hypogaea]